MERREENNKKSNLSVIELCSGMGAQIKGINRTNLFNTKVVATADLDKEVVVSYAAIHCGLTNTMINEYKDYPSKEQMVNELTEKRLGYDFKKDEPYNWEKLSRKKDKTKSIEKFWLANFLSHNLGDIMQIKELPSCELLTYSTPCTDLSIAGKKEGLKWTCQDCETEYDPSKLNVETRYICPHCGSKNIKSTRSGLLYEVERLLVKAKENNNLPKFLLMENVDALVSKKYINSFNDWIDRLNDLGYNSYYQTINAKNAGIPQNRNRIFCVSILKDIDTKTYEFPKPFDSGLRLKDLLETDCNVTDKYFLSDEVQARLQITDSKFDKNINGNTESKVSRNNLKIVRKLTPKEAHRLMGFDDEDYEKCKSVGMSDTQGYKQSGNSIVVNVISLLAEHLYKAQYDNKYTCTDERYQENFTRPQGNTHKVYNPLKGKTPYGWHFEQEVYLPKGITRTLKAGGGSGNIPKVILNQYYFTVEDGHENCIEKFDYYEDAYDFYCDNEDAMEIFCFDLNDELAGCVNSKK